MLIGQSGSSSDGCGDAAPSGLQLRQTSCSAARSEASLSLITQLACLIEHLESLGPILPPQHITVYKSRKTARVCSGSCTHWKTWVCSQSTSWSGLSRRRSCFVCPGQVSRVQVLALLAPRCCYLPKMMRLRGFQLSQISPAHLVSQIFRSSTTHRSMYF